MAKSVDLNEAVTAIHALKNGVSALNTEIALLRNENTQIKQVVARQKRGMKLLVISVAVDILLSVAALAGGFIIKGLADKADEQSSVAVINCRAANELGKAQKELWGPLLGTDERKPGETDVAYATRQDFKATIEKLSRQRNCDNATTDIGTPSVVTRGRR